MPSSTLSKLKNVSARDRRMIEDIEVMLGPEPTEMGLIKNMFWGRFRDDLALPYPTVSKAERAKCDALLDRLREYLENEHPAVQIDQEEEIPEWVIRRYFDLGVMGMTIPEQYGGLGLGVTSYNRVLEMIGSYCGSSGVMVSAHQSIGCKAIMLFGTEQQKKEYLPKVASEYLSAFCLSEPQVGSDAAGQETRCEVTDDGQYFILNGEKKWSTSGAMAGMLTVMAKQKVLDTRTGKTKDGITALICTPDMEGVEIFEKNRSKTGIRGTWQARIRFDNVRIPRANLLHKEGQGLKVALTCLNYGRCTLSAGVTGAAKRAFEQGTKWAQTRYQFGRPLADFELVQQKIARMAALTFAMDSMLYMATGMLDRGDKDIMVETAACKVFCSAAGWEVIDDAMQLMGGEGYVTENGFERLWRDNRIHRIVEGSNEVMRSFVFAYGGKQLAEQMVGIQEAVGWNAEETATGNLNRIASNLMNFQVLKAAVPLGAELFFGIKPSRPIMYGLHPSLESFGERLAGLLRDHSYWFKIASKWHREEIIQHQVVQARIADNAIYMFAMAASLSRMDDMLRSGEYGVRFVQDRTAFEHAFDLLELRIGENVRELADNADESMLRAASAARRHNDTLANDRFAIHESSPIAAGKGKPPAIEHVKQFPGEGKAIAAGHNGHGKTESPARRRSTPAAPKEEGG